MASQKSCFQLAFEIRPILNHYKSGHVWFLDPHCNILLVGNSSHDVNNQTKSSLFSYATNDLKNRT